MTGAWGPIRVSEPVTMNRYVASSATRSLAVAAALSLALASPAQVELSPGEGVFTYRDGGANADRPVRVHYVYPEGFDRSERPRILFGLHGSSRDALEQVSRLRNYAHAHDTLLLCPEFALASWPDNRSYTRGNVRDGGGRIRPREDWSFSTIVEIFSAVASQLPQAPGTFDLQGHSAGAQFVHRMVLLLPDAPIGRVVAANAGWYLLPDGDERYPNGIENVPVDGAALAAAFARELTVAVGELDNDPTDPNLSQSGWALAQGPHRNARGQFFYAHCRERAAALGLPFRWRLVEVPGVGHVADQMIPAAAEALFGSPSLRLVPLDDAYVMQNSRTYGTRSDVLVDGDSLRIAYLKFDLRGLEQLDIAAAALEMAVTDGSAALQTVRAVSDDSWSEETIHYLNRPESFARVATGFGGSAGQVERIGLTEHVRLHRGQRMSISLESESADGFGFSAKESGRPAELLIWLRDDGSSPGQSYGAGTAGTGALIPGLTALQEPVRGGLLELELRAAPGGRPFLLLRGPERTQQSVFGIELLVNPAGAGSWSGWLPAGGRWVQQSGIPYDPVLNGEVFRFQALFADPEGPLGLSASPGLELVVR